MTIVGSMDNFRKVKKEMLTLEEESDHLEARAWVLISVHTCSIQASPEPWVSVERLRFQFGGWDNSVSI